MEALQPLGDAVRRARQAQGLTLKDLAARSGLSPRFLSDLEHGKGNISIARLLEVGRALDTRLQDLVAPLDETGAVPVLALVGLRGAGKTTVGRRVASRLGWRFVELDDEVATAAGLPLSQIFEIHGEGYYRRLERETLRRLLADPGAGLVLATGGGIVTDPDSWTLLRARARTTWLKAEPEEHYQRVMDQGDMRPMANRPGAMAELRAILTARAPLYAEAGAQVDTSALGLDGTVEAVAAQLG